MTRSVFMKIVCKENFDDWGFDLCYSFDYSDSEGLSPYALVETELVENKPVLSIIRTVLRSLKVGCFPLNFSRDIIDPTEAIFYRFSGKLIIGEDAGNESVFSFDVDLKTNNIDVSLDTGQHVEIPNKPHTIDPDMVLDMFNEFIEKEIK